MKKTIKYQYAKDSEGLLININELNKNYIGKYFCLTCGNELLTKCGDERVHHFAHKNDVNNCSKETYLHELGKKIFYNTYMQCINENETFYVLPSLFTNINKICKYYGIIKTDECIIKNIPKLDLVSIFKKIELERKYNNFVPDITLINNDNEVIFIEIYVTHPCEKEKIDSKIKIIEINIKDEKDIGLILGKILSENNEKIRYYNFEDFNVSVEPMCIGNKESNYYFSLIDGRKYYGYSFKQEFCKQMNANKEIIKHACFTSSSSSTKIRTISRNAYRGTGIDYIESQMKRPNYKSRSNKKKKKY